MNAVEIIKRDGILTEEEQFAVIDEDVQNFGLVKNQTEAAQHKAIIAYDQDWYGPEAVKFLVDPTDDVLIAAFRLGDILEYIKDPSEHLQLLYIEHFGDQHDLFNSVKNPSPDVAAAAITAYPWSISRLENPSKELQQLAIDHDADVISDIKNLDRDIQLTLLNLKSDLLSDIQNPCREVLVHLALNDPGALADRNDLDVEFQLLAVKTDPTVAGMFPHPEVIQWVKDNC